MQTNSQGRIYHEANEAWAPGPRIALEMPWKLISWYVQEAW
jgi:hypothetical protein